MCLVSSGCYCHTGRRVTALPGQVGKDACRGRQSKRKFSTSSNLRCESQRAPRSNFTLAEDSRSSITRSTTLEHGSWRLAHPSQSICRDHTIHSWYTPTTAVPQSLLGGHCICPTRHTVDRHGYSSMVWRTICDSQAMDATTGITEKRLNFGGCRSWLPTLGSNFNAVLLRHCSFSN
jgi:hypothetical protein